MITADPVREVLEFARWSPSGDNTQPWRFERTGPLSFRIHGHDTREHCVYDLDGRPSQISIGAMVETAAIAASRHGLSLNVRHDERSPETQPRLEVDLTPDSATQPSPWLAAVPRRSVNRFPYTTQPLSALQKRAMQDAAGDGWTLRWYESMTARWAWARYLWRNAGLRLTLPEAFETHRNIIDWHARWSNIRLPDQALGASAATLKLMRWAMVSWDRIAFMNRWMGGTLTPRLEMDLLPALRCAAHFVLAAERPPQYLMDYVNAGRAIQRVWLCATTLGLVHQPAVTPLVFSRYVREGRRFSSIPTCEALARSIEEGGRQLMGDLAPRAVWIGRIGHAPQTAARSLRRPLDELLR
ncbi:MAG: molybdopterin biosynthesis protein MoeY [Burkholderiaceae bacterium]|nr:molybdopterin biosynthesis protein MoeY [Burkholderiaceae bacterium]